MTTSLIMIHFVTSCDALTPVQGDGAITGGKTEGFSLSDELEFEQLPRDVKGLLLEVGEEINTVWKNFPRMVSMSERSCLNILPGS